MKNSSERGSVRWIVFKEEDTWYGIALEFNLVVEADDRDVVMFELQEAIRGYVESQKKIKGSKNEPLNQKPEKEYQDLWSNLQSDEPVPSPYQVECFGYTKV